MGKMTFPLLKQGCLELTSVHRRETDVGRCWRRRARNRPGTASASRVCSRNRPEPTGFQSSVTNFFPLPCPDRNTVSKGPAPCTGDLGYAFSNQGRHSHGGNLLPTCVMCGSQGT